MQKYTIANCYGEALGGERLPRPYWFNITKSSQRTVAPELEGTLLIDVGGCLD